MGFFRSWRLTNPWACGFWIGVVFRRRQSAGSFIVEVAVHKMRIKRSLLSNFCLKIGAHYLSFHSRVIAITVGGLILKSCRGIEHIGAPPDVCLHPGAAI